MNMTRTRTKTLQYNKSTLSWVYVGYHKKYMVHLPWPWCEIPMAVIWSDVKALRAVEITTNQRICLFAQH